MKNAFLISIDWNLPIIPSKSIAGVNLGEKKDVIKNSLSQYVFDKEKSLYQFKNSPVLKLVSNESFDDKYFWYTFFIYDDNLTNWWIYFNSPEHMGVERRAFSIIIKDGLVYALKVWNFECLKDGEMSTYSYKGKTPEGIGLSDSINKLLNYTSLNFDSREEWFYCDESYGGLEVTGYGVSLDDMPEQRITALAVVNIY